MDLKAILNKAGLNGQIRTKAAKTGQAVTFALRRIGLTTAALNKLGLRRTAPGTASGDGGDAAVQGDGRARLVGGSAAGLVALLVVILLVVGSWGGDGSGAAEKQEGKPAKGPVEAAVSISPEDGADGVATSDALSVSVANGTLARVLVKDGQGRYVDGEFAKGRTVWKPEAHLLASADYSVEAVAEDAAGRTATERTAFSTVEPDDTFVGRFQPENGDTVGVGMPVTLDFNRAITERQEVEEAISVTAEPEAEIEGHWFGNSRLDFRPEEYWEPGTEVTLSLHLDGVKGADGLYGTQEKSVTFGIGRSQVSVVDARTKKMTVTRDGEKIRTIPISSGTPENPTYNGQMVVSEKHPVIRMNGETVGFGDDYDIKDVPHAMRLSTSGTFIHGNYWAGSAAFGNANTSHGCIGLFDVRSRDDSGTPGAWFFRNSMIGDIVEVKNSQDETIQPGNGLNGWNMDWEEWTAEQ